MSGLTDSDVEFIRTATSDELRVELIHTIERKDWDYSQAIAKELLQRGTFKP